jgi:hypothetical protein
VNAIRLFTGFDKREAVGWHVFAQSVIEKTSEPVSIVPLSAGGRDGSNTFTYSRFLVPYFCDFQGWAIWADGADMVLAADLSELWAFRQAWYAAQVVKHEYTTKHPRKYRGTEMESANYDYPRKNWSSLILWDCGHYMNRVLTPDFVASHDGAFLHRFGWLQDDRIGELPPVWNWLIDEYGANSRAKLLHFTAGIPSIKAYAKSPHAQLWRAYEAKMQQSPAERIAEIASAR